jgi:hypothetical protein
MVVFMVVLLNHEQVIFSSGDLDHVGFSVSTSSLAKTKKTPWHHTENSRIDARSITKWVICW